MRCGRQAVDFGKKQRQSLVSRCNGQTPLLSSLRLLPRDFDSLPVFNIQREINSEHFVCNDETGVRG